MTGNYKDKGRAVFFAAMLVLSVFAMAVTVPGAVVAEHSPDDEVDLGTADRLYQGQSGIVNITNVAGSSATVDLYYDDGSDDGDWIREYNVDGAQELSIDTNNLESGSYEIRGLTANNDDTFNATGVDTDVVTFDVRVQELSAEFADSTVTNLEGDSSNTTLTVDSPRASFPIHVSSDQLSVSELQTLLGDQVTDTHTDDGYVVIQDRGDFDANFEGVDAGNYNLTIAAGDTSAEDTVSISVTDEEIDVYFDDSTTLEERSNIAEVGLNFENSDSAYVRIGDAAETNYEVVLEVTDGDDDGEATVNVNTALAHAANQSNETDANGDMFFAGGDDDIVTVHNVTAGNLSSPLAAGDYEMSVALDADFKNEQDTAYLTLEERSSLSEDAVQTHTAPDAVANMDEFDETTVTDTDLIANEDTLLVSVESSGLFAYFQDEDNLSEVENGISLTLEEQESSINAEPETWSTDDGTLDATVVSADQSEGLLIFSVDYQDAGIGADAGYDVSFSVNSDNDYIGDDEGESAESQFTLETRELEWDDSAAEVPNSADAVVTGTTNVAPGTEVDSRARASGEFVMPTSTVVELNDDGERFFAVSYDFSDFAAGTEFSLRATSGDLTDTINSVLTEAPEKSGDFDVAVDGPEEVDAGDDATFTVTVTNNGDAEADACVQFNFDGTDYDGCGLTLEGGASDSVEFDIDTEGLDGDYEWTVDLNDEEVADGTLTVNGDGSSDGSDSDGSDSDGSDSDGSDSDGSDSDGDDSDGDDSDGDDSSSDDSSDDDSSDGDDDGQPGFGVAVALVALLAAAMLALRRQN